MHSVNARLTRLRLTFGVPALAGLVAQNRLKPELRAETEISLVVIEDPSDVRAGGQEHLGRPKWILSGETADELALTILCVLDEDAAGDTTFICDPVLGAIK